MFCSACGLPLKIAVPARYDELSDSTCERGHATRLTLKKGTKTTAAEEVASLHGTRPSRRFGYGDFLEIKTQGVRPVWMRLEPKH